MKRLALVLLTISLVFTLGACATRPRAVEVQPDQVLQPVKVAEPTTTVILDVVKFDWDKFDIRADQQLVVDRVAELLIKYFDTKIHLFGFASVEGTDENNQELSQNRADAVQDALIKQGVSSDSIKISVGKGETATFGPDLPSNRIVLIESE